MRIIYLSNSLVPSQEANAIQVVKMCSALAKNGCKVIFFGRKGTSSIKDIFAYYDVSNSFQIRLIKVLDIRIIRRIIFAWKVLKQIRREQLGFTIFGRDYYLMGFFAKFGLIQSPLWLEVHQPPKNVFQSKLIRWVLLYSKFEQLIVISHTLKEEYHRRYGSLVTNKIIVAHDGADAEELPDKLRSSKSYQQRGPRVAIGYIGSFYPGKGMETIAQLVPLLTHFDFHIVGGTESEIERWRQKVKQPNIYFHGFVSPSRIYEKMTEFDIVLAPYLESVFVGGRTVNLALWMSPLKVFEYMSAGLPIVCTDLPVIREILREGENALLAKAADLRSWQDQITRLAEDIQLRKHIGQQAQLDFFQHYTWDQRAKSILNNSILQP